MYTNDNNSSITPNPNPDPEFGSSPGPISPDTTPPKTALLPDWWRCLRRGPVSGRYEGKSSSGRRVLDLRIDIDPTNTNSPVMDRISGDFYRLFEFRWFGRTWRWRVYKESWIIDSPKVQWSRCEVNITGKVRFWKGFHPLTQASIRIPWATFRPAGPVEARFTEIFGATDTFICQRKSSSFRDVELEVDVADRVNNVPILPDYDTHGHNTRPPGIDQRDIGVAAAYEEAGIALTINPTQTIIDDSDPAFNSWSVAELHDAMETHFSRYPGQWPKWKLWGLLAGRFVNSGTGGIMFDYSGAQEPPQRQGFAVFREHSWFNNLTDNPSSQAEQQAMRHFLYTWVHEAGHAFNFMHSWDKSRPDSLSWMNYDWRYDARNGAGSYWSGFEFRFDDEELLHMRHGDRASVIMGGDDWASGGHMDDPGDMSTEVSGTMPLELKVDSQGYFEFLEPVTVELRLRNLVKDMPVAIDARLQPDFGNVKIMIEKPNGNVVRFHPPVCQVGEVLSRDLASLGNKGPDRYAELINLSFGGTGFYFDNPGTYRIRAFYEGPDDVFIPSNVHQIRIGFPETREVDRIAQDYFDTQVGLALFFGGSRSQYLQKGMDALRRVCDQFSDTDRGVKTAVTVARTLSTTFFALNEKNKLVAKKPSGKDREEALKITNAGLKKFQSLGKDDRRHNFAYTELAEVRCRCLSDKGDSDKAEQEKADLLKRLEARSVKRLVLDAIKQRLMS